MKQNPLKQLECSFNKWSNLGKHLFGQSTLGCRPVIWWPTFQHLCKPYCSPPQSLQSQLNRPKANKVIMLSWRDASAFPCAESCCHHSCYMTSAHTIMHIPVKGIDIPRVSYGSQRLDKHRHRQSGSLTGQASVNGFLSLWPSMGAMVKTIKTSQNPALLERKLRIHKKQVPGWKSPCTLQIRSFENMVPPLLGPSQALGHLWWYHKE